ncbi:MAG: DUF4446 family protein [Thermoleophilia bacterium]
MEGTLLVAVAAAAGAILALAGVLALWVAFRRLRAAQQVLLPDGATAGLIDRQASLQRAVVRVEEGLSDLQSLVERQGEVTERSLATSLRFQGLVRYDAYRDMGGSQSWSIALIDGNGTGAVVTCLHARDHARMYMKELEEGTPSQRLSPEEEKAVALATGRPARQPAAPPEPEAEAVAPAAPEPSEPTTGEFPVARPPASDDG